MKTLLEKKEDLRYIFALRYFLTKYYGIHNQGFLYPAQKKRSSSFPKYFFTNLNKKSNSFQLRRKAGLFNSYSLVTFSVSHFCFDSSKGKIKDVFDANKVVGLAKLLEKSAFNINDLEKLYDDYS